MKIKLLITILTVAFLNVNAQFNQYDLSIEPLTISGVPGLQSFAWGRINGEWILIGGRTDGLHRRQPPFSFLETGNNKNIYVINPVTKQIWSAPLSSLQASLNEQLQSTNMQFIQEGNDLYLTGGYGYSATIANHKTHAYLTVIDLAGLVQAIKNSQPITSYFKQVSDPSFAVTGGHFAKLDSVFYLACGNEFNGRYNPNNGPSFTQVYSNEIRRFVIKNSTSAINYNILTPWNDSLQLHRRDYNLTPGFDLKKKPNYTIWSGVFKYNVDLPWLNTVNFNESGYSVTPTFNQLLNQYHSANLALFDEEINKLYTIFFGGIAQFYVNDSGAVIQNDTVPFVNTISYVVRDSSNQMQEYAHQLRMPGFLGASAEFIPNHTAPLYSNDVFKLNDFTSDSVLAGYIVGGINSSRPNIFLINDGTQSSASNTIFKVWFVRKKTTTSTVKVISPVGITLYPNPAKSIVTILFDKQNEMRKGDFVVFNQQGQAVMSNPFNALDGSFSFDVRSLSRGVYYLQVNMVNNTITKKLVIE